MKALSRLIWTPFLVASVSVAVALRAQQPDPLIGVWKLNVAKSKFPGQPLKSRTDRYEFEGKDGFKYSSEEVDSSGKTRRTTYAAQFDGKYYIMGGSPVVGDHVAIFRIDANTVDSRFMKDGKPGISSRRVVSKDGRTMTYIAGNRPAMIFDKQ